MVINTPINLSPFGAKHPLAVAISNDPFLLQWVFALARLTVEERHRMLSRGAQALAERLERPDLEEELAVLASAPVFDRLLDDVSATFAS
jgi:hypothetical protein